jgi:hypothetical protein
VPSTRLTRPSDDDSSVLIPKPGRRCFRPAKIGPKHRVSRKAFLKASLAGAALAIVPATPTQLVIPPKSRRVTAPRRTYALEQIRRMRGGAQSHLMRCSDGHYYVVKFQNNPQHRRVLVNEMLGTRLAAQLGLPTAPLSPIYVSGRLIELTPDLSMEMPRSRIPCEPGMQFGSRYLSDPHCPRVHPFVPRWEWDLVANRADFAGMFVFDKWTCNTDGRQVLFQSCKSDSPLQAVGFRAVMVDQGFCFNSGEWNFPDSPIRNFYFDRVVYDRILSLDDFEPWLSRLESEISPAALVRAANEIPSEWYESDRSALDDLLERLDRRRKMIREMVFSVCSTSPKVFPNWRMVVRQRIG